MSEEEKEAIEIMLEDVFFWQGKSSFITRHRYKELSKKMYKEIDKLQKEIEEKTTILMAGADKVKQLEKENEELKETDLTSVYMKGFYDSKSKWEEKVKNKIKELDETKQYWTEDVIDILGELLEEDK